ncbi:centrosomal AT-AC splicing factor-like isoform X2 [Liolophura sinensis]|uniref:centrosomal AT-AC splicing factor-like isoform X2 n=1 Tax=Liolophura sinensis TaxID=3198878 RepID=UPI0031593D7E
MITMEQMTGEVKESSKRFSYCSFCRLSHKKWKKHVYSKRHQDIMVKILAKFVSKVKSAQDSANQPCVERVSFERDAKVWCYFCAEDVDKHTHADTYTLMCGAFIDHLNSDTHVLMTNKFLHCNLLDKNKLTQLIIDDSQLKSFKENASKSIISYKLKMRQSLKKEADRIQAIEESRSEWKRKKTQISDPGSVSQILNIHAPIRRTLTAKGAGLTCIIKDGEERTKEGNIFSGAVPPWLRPDPEPDTTYREIGPTMEDFNKHLEKEKKKKLPPNRVGANFNHTAQTSDQWLPSFGRVWSKGRRLQSKNFFENQSKGLRKHDIVSTDLNKVVSWSKRNSSSSTIQPYQRKRLPTASVTSLGATSLGADSAPVQSAPNSSFISRTSGGLPQLHPGISELSVTHLPAVPDASRLTHLTGNTSGASCLGLTISAHSASPVYQSEITQPWSSAGSVNFRTVFDTSEHRGMAESSVKMKPLPASSPMLIPYKRKRQV